MSTIRYVAIGDSFTEGVGDELPDGRVRGWADLVAQGWADSMAEPVEYANLAIRGKLAWPIVDEQLEPALALKPTHLSFNGGGNDMIRLRTSIPRVEAAFSRIIERCDEENVRLILLSGANPSAQLPLSRMIQRRGDTLTSAVRERIADRPDIIRAFNWPDRELSSTSYWSEDRLHMNSRGHHRVAARVLTALGMEPPAGWWSLPPLPEAARMGRSTYYREHLGPWVHRRLTGASSGDDRESKHLDWTVIEPSAD